MYRSKPFQEKPLSFQWIILTWRTQSCKNSVSKRLSNIVFNDKKMTTATSASTGFHGANLATAHQETLADATEALKVNQAMIANLARRNDDKDDTIATLRAEVASLKTEIRLLRERRGSGGNTGRQGKQQQLGAGHFQGHPDFPLSLWDKLIPQAVMTLNFLRASRVNPKLSAFEQLNGVFDFNRTPLGPLGCKVIFHEMPTARGSWSPWEPDQQLDPK